MAINDNLAKSIDDISQLSTNNNYYRGEPVVKHSLHSTVSQKSLIDGSPFRSRLRLRRLRKKLLHSIKLKKLTNHFQSTGTYNKNLQDSKPIQAIIDDRLKRFRMLDPDEFQEMLNSLSPQIPDEQIKDFNNMDKIDGMQLESKFMFNY